MIQSIIFNYCFSSELVNNVITYFFVLLLGEAQRSCQDLNVYLENRDRIWAFWVQ